MKKEKALLALLVCSVLSVQTVMANTINGASNQFNSDGKVGGAGHTGTSDLSDYLIQGQTFDKNGALHDGGALGIYGKGKTTIDGSTFTNNTAQLEQGGGKLKDGEVDTNHPIGGGALSLGASSNTDVKGSIFKDNKSGTDGGAISTRHWDTGIDNSNAHLSVSGSTFEGNSAENNGGAIFNSFLKTTVSGNFMRNSAKRSGGAVFNQAGSDITVGGTFEGNSALYSGGAIHNNGNLTVEDGSVFRNNTTLWPNRDTAEDYPEVACEMGTIYSEGTEAKAAEVHIGNNVKFENNTAGAGAGVYLYGNNTATIGDNVTFSGNKSLKDNKNDQGGGGGAISLVAGKSNGTPELEIGNNATFEGNEGTYGGAITVGKEKDATGTAQLEIGINSVFRNNKAETFGGAIQNEGKTTIGDGAVFDGNSSQILGGAIANQGDMGTLKNATFVNNSATSYGGAIYQSGKLDIENSLFKNNSAGEKGGAITALKGMSITGSTFDSNSATSGFGGAIYNSSTEDVIVKNSDLINNSAYRGGAIYGTANTKTVVNGGTYSGNTVTGLKDAAGNSLYGQGGAIFTNRNGAELQVEGAVFDGNSAENEGGAIWSGNKTNITDSVFANNSTTGTAFTGDTPDYKTDAEGGGAIFVGSNSTATVKGSEFTGNSSGTVGGAIATRSNAASGSSKLTVESSNFSGNSAAKNGGAIASYVEADIKDSSFTGNSAGEKGGAVWANGDVTVTADGSDVVFAGNSAADGGDIYMDKLGTKGSVGELKFESKADKNITIADGISGAEKYNVEKTGDGTLTFNGEIKNAKMSVDKGTLHLAEGHSIVDSTITMKKDTTLDTTDGAFESYDKGVIEAKGALNLKADISSATGKTDSFEGLEGEVTLQDFNPVGDSLSGKGGSISLEEISRSLGIDPSKLSVGEAAKQNHRFLTPIRYFDGRYDEATTSFISTPTGNGYKDFNPAVMASPIAAQLGGYLTQLNSYDEAFRNMDMYMLMTKKQRQALKLRNKYAAADGNLIFDPTNTPYEDKAVWIRPYATFENVPLKGGPRVSNVAYGSFFGAESELYDLGNGWDGMYGVYAGYNGSHQAYDGIGIYQNGGTLGLVGMAYKGNFFTGLTINAGANVGEASTFYGQDNFTMLMAGIANKTGYNWELADGKFIIQPSLMLSYSFVNTFDYTNAAGVHIDSDPLHAIQVEPGIKFIGNLKNGWQPYAGVSVVMNFMDKTKFMANDATLPDLSVKPFVRYGLGVRKTWGEKLTGFFQTYFTNGGRNGVGFQLGFRVNLGKNGNAIKKGSVPERQKTELKLSNIR